MPISVANIQPPSSHSSPARIRSSACAARCSDPGVRAWYAEQDVRHGWSAAVLARHISTDRHARIGAAPSTFPQTLTPAETDQTRELLQDPYVLDFLALDPHHSERDREDAIVARLIRFLTELGTGFALVGRQCRLAVGRSEYFPTACASSCGCDDSSATSNRPYATRRRVVTNL
jgi:predicted nuclease of restriction endonuclease-like (RecB) superfamily